MPHNQCTSIMICKKPGLVFDDRFFDHSIDQGADHADDDRTEDQTEMKDGASEDQGVPILDFESIFKSLLRLTGVLCISDINSEKNTLLFFRKN